MILLIILIAMITCLILMVWELDRPNRDRRELTKRLDHLLDRKREDKWQRRF